MKNFFDQMEQEAINNIKYNESVTENGAIGFRTTGKALIDLNFAVSSLRNVSEDDIINMFIKAYKEDKEKAITWLFFARDIREGLGERKIFKTCIKYLFNNKESEKDNNKEQKIISTLLQLIEEYGRYDDLYALAGISDRKYDKYIGEYIFRTIKDDEYKMVEKKPVSLLAKWLKSEKASSKESKKLAKWTIEVTGMTPSQYRRRLSALRKYIDVTEVKMTANEWDKIDYSKVPSKAGLIYKNAFIKHDEKRYSEFLKRVEEGVETINAGTLYPYEIVNKYTSYSRSVKDFDKTLEEIWKALKETNINNKNTLVVADGSGSMEQRVSGGKATALMVANALAIYFAERAEGPYKNKFITFSERPQFVDLSRCKTLKEKLEKAYSHNECANTNIKGVFNLVLDTAISNNLKQEELPTNILVLSDMEFDGCITDREEWDFSVVDQKALFQDISEKYKKAGYKLPRLVFWNICSRTGTIPLLENEYGVALMSGFSQNIADMVMSGELDPYKCLIKTLNKSRYNDVRSFISLLDN